MASVQSLAAPTDIFKTATPEPLDPLQKNAFGQDAFLKLLVSQLRFQDPSEPVDNEAFLGQMAQFTSVEQIVKLNQGIEKLASSSVKNDALAILGAEVDIVPTGQVLAEGEASKTVTGLVTQIRYEGSTPMLQVAGKEYSFDEVVKVRVPNIKFAE